MRDCDHCGDAPGTVPLGSLLVYCEPCVEEAGDEFEVDFGYMSREEADARRIARWRRREVEWSEEAA